MKVVFAFVLATLSVIESVLLAVLLIPLFVAPGGSGEFTGIDRLGYLLGALMYLPVPVFLVIFILVLLCYSPQHHKAFRSLTWALIVAVITVPVALPLSERVGDATLWAVVINLAVLTVWIAVILRKWLTRNRDNSLQSAS